MDRLTQVCSLGATIWVVAGYDPFCRVKGGSCEHNFPPEEASPVRNRDLIISNLRESIGQLESIIECLETGVVPHRNEPLKYNMSHFRVGLAHAYHHMNFAWHIRNVSRERAIACEWEDFEDWSKFPTSLL